MCVVCVLSAALLSTIEAKNSGQQCARIVPTGISIEHNFNLLTLEELSLQPLRSWLNLIEGAGGRRAMGATEDLQAMRKLQAKP